ncbi:MAG: ATP-binding protein [Oscillospiraceae bacterium]|jgi:hypothetical protein|nr:ATP-binding protein [Oscillospiraceae bacterium]
MEEARPETRTNVKVAPRRIASTVLGALRSGVVPRVGLEYIAVGRAREIDALLRDADIIADGGATFRFISGKYGSGKSFLLQTVRNYAMERGFAVMDADLSPERRLSGTHGQGVSTYRELINNLSTHTKPDGGALQQVLDKLIGRLEMETLARDSAQSEDKVSQTVRGKILELAAKLEGMVNGYDFARVILMYYNGYAQDDDDMKSKALRFFRAEYGSKTEVRQELGIRTYVNDENWYEMLKLFASFLTVAGYKGLLVMLDELVNLFRIPFRVTREYNYEKLLAIYNDVLQGKASGIGFVLVSTPQSLEDSERGIFSYEALRSRLADGRFADNTIGDIMSPIIKIQPLTYEEMFVLLEKVAGLHRVVYGSSFDISNEDMLLFLKAEYERIGAKTNITPRSVIRDFIEILGRLSQDPTATVRSIISTDADCLSIDSGDMVEDGAQQDEFAEFFV